MHIPMHRQRLWTSVTPKMSEAVHTYDQTNYEGLKNVLKASLESVDDRLQRYVSYFTVPTPHLRTMIMAFEHELSLGLDLHRKCPGGWDRRLCSFKMLDACIKNLPNGQEAGIYYALDFGGTNFRVVRTCLQGNGKVVTSQCKQSLLGATTAAKLPKGLLDRQASATLLFDFFSETCKEYMVAQNDFKQDAGNEYTAAFTFSFPCIQRAINSAVLLEWTKGFETGRGTKDPIEGLDVVQLLNASFERFRVPMEITCVMNDTVGTLLDGCYETNRDNHPPCMVGLILGTGMNACYYEKEALDYGYKGKVINIECGNFNRELPSTNVDFELDFAETTSRGRQRLEKMLSGAYVGEIVRRATIKVLQHLAPSRAWIPFSLSCEAVSMIIEDTSPDFARTGSVLANTWSHSFSYSDLLAIRQLCRVIMDRAAALSAVVIAATARKTQHLTPAMGGLSVAIDGSLYKYAPFFQRQIRCHLDAILGRSGSNLIHLVTADDGSGKGAAICASILGEAEQ